MAEQKTKGQHLADNVRQLKRAAKTNGQKEYVNKLDHFTSVVQKYEIELMSMNEKLLQFRETTRNSYNILIEQQNNRDGNARLSCLQLAANCFANQNLIHKNNAADKGVEMPEGLVFNEDTIITLSDRFLDYVNGDKKELLIPNLDDLEIKKPSGIITK